MDNFDLFRAVPTEIFSIDERPRTAFNGKDAQANRLLHDQFVLATTFKLGQHWNQIDSDHNNTLSRSELDGFNTALESEIDNGKMDQNDSNGVRFLCDNFDDIKGLHEGWTGSSDEIERKDCSI